MFKLFDPGPGAPGGPRKVPPLGYPEAPGPKTNQSKKTRNLKELTEQRRQGPGKLLWIRPEIFDFEPELGLCGRSGLMATDVAAFWKLLNKTKTYKY